MAQGSIIWRCRTCGNKTAGSCKHPRAGYSVVYRLGKHQKWLAVGRIKKVAERRLTEILTDLHGGTYREPRPVTFRDFSQRWLRDYAEASLKPEEIRLLLQHADEPYRTLFLAAVLTGLRRGELLGLQWGDVDWRNNVIHVRRSLYWQNREELASAGSPQPLWRFSTPKSRRSIRTVVRSPRLREALELHRLTCPVSPDDLVFCSREGTPIHAENMIRREFLPTLTRAGLRRIRFHDLRHTYTALLIAQGAHAKFIQNQLGHASIQTTLDRYGHLLPEAQQGTGERLDVTVFGPARGESAGKALAVAG